MDEPWKDIHIVLDLTKMQRKEENLGVEAEKRNTEMGDDERKNRSFGSLVGGERGVW